MGDLNRHDHSLSRADLASNSAIVNSHNGWDPLEEVIVGGCYHLNYDNDVSFRLFFYDAVKENPGPWTIEPGEQERRLREEQNEDLQAFRDVLRAGGITVRIPEEPQAASTIRTPDWSSSSGHATMPRDTMLIVGDTIFETPPLVRSRYLETDLYKRLLADYAMGGARWVAAPKSRLRAENYDFSHAIRLGYSGPVPSDPSFEMMFDGAQVLRFGEDLLFNCSTANHRLGIPWLTRQVGSQYRVHEVNVTGNHIDARVLALRPGTLLLHEEVDHGSLPAFLHSWDVVRYSPPRSDIDPSVYGDRPILASPGLGMNVLSLDEEKVVVQDTQTTFMKDLEQAGFEPVPVSWRHGRMVGGGPHCMTLDVRRRGSLEDYRG